jgi:hypothetical protein
LKALLLSNTSDADSGNVSKQANPISGKTRPLQKTLATLTKLLFILISDGLSTNMKDFYYLLQARSYKFKNCCIAN